MLNIPSINKPKPTTNIIEPHTKESLSRSSDDAIIKAQTMNEIPININKIFKPFITNT